MTVSLRARDTRDTAAGSGRAVTAQSQLSVAARAGHGGRVRAASSVAHRRGSVSQSSSIFPVSQDAGFNPAARVLSSLTKLSPGPTVD